MDSSWIFLRWLYESSRRERKNITGNRKVGGFDLLESRQTCKRSFLAEKRAGYGQRIIATLPDGLVQRYSNNFSEKNLRRMMQFASVFSDEQIVVSAIRQLSWTHFIALIPLKSDLQREFYLELCKAEAWNVKTLREKNKQHADAINKLVRFQRNPEFDPNA
ncbi:DUF1016 N-terminal domain-containing protein [Parapedobacter sp. 2B3]|uniref:DUF1016 N-terminal domain-containing protein n=1 Tax=Parapedobacter sp. 2B3 TaxID=3342381 RepID=UPI0035B63EB2